MSDENKIQVEFGGQVAPSYDSSVEHVKRGLREQAAESAKATAEIVAHTAKAYAEHALLERIIHKGVAAYKEWRGAASEAATAAAEVGAQQAVMTEKVNVGSAAFSVLRFSAARALSSVLPVAAGAVSGLSLVLVSVRLVSGALHLLEKASGAATTGLGKFSFLEDLTGRLRAFTGSAEGARQKLLEINSTFRGTPVNTPDAVDAFRSARAADSGSGELSSGKGLTLLGDVAASSGNGISTVAGAVGGLYSALENGQPIQQTADHLREMGVISGDTRAMLDRLQASGKSGPEVWAALRVELEKSTGAMKEQQQTLSSLQKELQTAKDQLYSSFAEGSVPYEKDKLTAKTAILQKLQPAAQEAGDVYGGAKSSISDLIKKLLELIGVKAASDKALSSSSALKTVVDGYILARVALATFGVVAIPVLAAVAIAAGTLSLAVVATAAAFAAVIAVVAAAAGGLFIYKLHADKANEARLAFLKGTDDLIAGIDKEGKAMVTVADKARLLAQAYVALKTARDGLANAKTPEEKADFQARIVAIQTRIRGFERQDDRNLKPGEARAKVEGDIKEYNDGKLTDEQKAEQAHVEAMQASNDAEQKRRRRYELEAQNTPEGRAEIKDENYKAGLSLLLEQARTDSESADLNAAKKWDVSDAAKKKVTDNADKKAKEDKEAADKKAKDDAEKVKQAREQRIGQADADSEAQLAAVGTEGIQRARDEYEIRRKLLEVKLREAEAEGDAVKLSKLKADYYRDQQEMAKKEADNTKATTASTRALTDEIASRQDAADKRQLEHEARTGKITDEQRRKGEAAILQRQQQRLEADAAAKEQEARDALGKGDQEKATRLTTEAQQIHAQADAKRDEALDLLNPARAARAPVADSLARLALGGNVSALPADLSAVARQQLVAIQETNKLLRDWTTKEPRRPDDRTGRFGR